MTTLLPALAVAWISAWVLGIFAWTFFVPRSVRLHLRLREVPAALLALLAGRAARRRLRFILAARRAAARVVVPPKPPKVLLPSVRAADKAARAALQDWQKKFPATSRFLGLECDENGRWHDPALLRTGIVTKDEFRAALNEYVKRTEPPLTLGRDWLVSPANPPGGCGVTMTGRAYGQSSDFEPGQLSDAVRRHLAANPGKTLTFEDMVTIVRQLKEENGESHDC